MGKAAPNAGVGIVTGDTKVVGRGGADQLFVNTAGVGLVPPGVHIGPERARPGDHIIVSGNIGEHGVAIMSVREGIDFGTVVTTDSAPLHRLVAAMLAARGTGAPVCHRCAIRPAAGWWRRSSRSRAPPRWASSSMRLPSRCPRPSRRPVRFWAGSASSGQRGQAGGLRRPCPQRRGAGGDAGAARRPDAAIIGRVVDEHPGMAVGRTPFGTTRVIERELGEQLPRIC